MESIIIKGKRYEIETKPYTGRSKEGHKFYCSMWETFGTARVHLSELQYGVTAEEAREKMNAVIRAYSQIEMF